MYYKIRYIINTDNVYTSLLYLGVLWHVFIELSYVRTESGSITDIYVGAGIESSYSLNILASCPNTYQLHSSFH